MRATLGLCILAAATCLGCAQNQKPIASPAAAPTSAPARPTTQAAESPLPVYCQGLDFVGWDKDSYRGLGLYCLPQDHNWFRGETLRIARTEELEIRFTVHNGTPHPVFIANIEKTGGTWECRTKPSTAEKEREPQLGGDGGIKPSNSFILLAGANTTWPPPSSAPYLMEVTLPVVLHATEQDQYEDVEFECRLFYYTLGNDDCQEAVVKGKFRVIYTPPPREDY